MPTKYGGGPNPAVRLDPWQNIVEVGWPSAFTHIAIEISVRRETVSVEEFLSCSPATEYFDGATLYTDRYTTDLIYSAVSDTVSSYSKYRNGEWSGGGLQDDDEITGLPDIDFTATLTPWTWVGHTRGTGTWPPEAASFNTETRRHSNLQQWVPITGSPIPDSEATDAGNIKVPHTSVEFAATNVATYQSRGVPIIDGEAPTICRVTEGELLPVGQLLAVIGPSGSPNIFDDLVAGTSPVMPDSAMDLDFSGVVATINTPTGSKTFRQVGLQTATAAFVGGRQNTGAIYVLLALDETEEPPEEEG